MVKEPKRFIQRFPKERLHLDAVYDNISFVNRFLNCAENFAHHLDEDTFRHGEREFSLGMDDRIAAETFRFPDLFPLSVCRHYCR